MDILKIVIDKDRNLDVKNSPECTRMDLLALACCLVVELSQQTGKSNSKVLRDIGRALKKNKDKLQ